MIWYKREKNSRQRFCYVMSVLIVMLGVISITKLPFDWDLRNNLPAIGTVKWFLLLVPAIILAALLYMYGYVLGEQTRLFAQWHQYLIKHGRKYSGKVVEVVERRSVRATDGENRIAHALRIRYFDTQEDTEKEFITPTLDFLVEDCGNATCDVYKVSKTPSWAVTNDNGYNSNSLQYSLNPIKLHTTLIKSSNQNWFGYVVADNYKDIKKIPSGGTLVDYIKVLLILALMIAVYYVFNR